MNLDGETNLKDRELATKTIGEDSLPTTIGHIDADSPNPDLDVWEG